MKFSKTILVSTMVGLLAACGSDSITEHGTFNMGVSDNPADADVVNIAFKQVVLKNSEGSISFDVSESGGLRHVDLRTVQGTDVEVLVTDQLVPLGEYQMCIYMQNNEQSDVTDSSYVSTSTNGIKFEGLVTNSNGSCGGVGAEDDDTGRLFFNKTFTIAAGNNTFVAEFELSKGLQPPHGDKTYWTLKPTSVQLLNVSEVGSINGQISPVVVAECADAAGGSVFSLATYLYPSGTVLENMADFRIQPYIESEVAPIASATVSSIVHTYEFGFVVAGSYSLGYTCLAQNDNPIAVNSLTDDFPFFVHLDEQGVEVMQGQATVRHFPADFSPE